MRRHKTLCLAPALVAAAIGGYFGLNRSSQYIASASIFADAPLPAPSTVGTTGGIAPPSGGQQALMNNFLATRNFLSTVAQKAALPGFSSDLPPLILEKSLAALGADIKTSTPGPNLMLVTVTRPDPGQATRVANALVDTFLSLERETIQRRAASQTAEAKAHLDDAAKSVTAAQKDVADYRAAHPDARTGSDAQLSLLEAVVGRAQDQYQAIQTAVGDALVSAPVVSASSLFVVDHPNAAYAKGHKKAVAMGAGGGLLAGLSLTLAALMRLVTRDNVLRTAEDVSQETGLPVVAEVSAAGRQHRQTDRAVARAPARIGAAVGGGGAVATSATGQLGSSQLDWAPATVVVACGSALRRLGTGPGPVAVTAAGVGHGCTTMALGLSLAKREDGDQPTIVMDLNLSSPGIAAVVGVEDAPGVAEVLRGEASIDDVLQWPDPLIGVIAAGNVDDPRALLALFRQSDLLSELVARGYAVIADLPPLPPAGRGDRVADLFWNVLVVVAAGATTLPAAREATESLTAPASAIVNYVKPAAWRRSRHSRGR